MFTYLLYSKKTGDLIHVHNDPEGGLSADELLQYVCPEAERKDIAFVPLEEGENTAQFPVFDINTQQIRSNQSLGQDAASAGSSIQSIQQ